MGKKLRQQRRGKGSNAYRKPPNYFKADVMFSRRPATERIQGEVIEFIDDPGHSAPLMRIVYEDGSENTLLAPEGIKLGDRIQEGNAAGVSLGNVLPLANVPDGMPVYNLECRAGDGGKLVRAAGNYATVVSHTGDIVSVLLPSKQTIDLSPLCRAEIGTVAGGGAEHAR